jgi:hypothetical protein
MASVIYITRAEHWSFEYREKAPIAEKEWLQYVREDPEFRPVTTLPGTIPGTDQPCLYYLDGCWAWSESPRDGTNRGLFQYYRNGIAVRDPNDEELAKAIDVARALNAVVIRDTGEVLT